MTHSFVETLPLVLDDPLTTLLRETSHDARLIRWTGTRDQEQDLTLGRCRSHLALPRIDSRQYLPPPLLVTHLVDGEWKVERSTAALPAPSGPPC